MSFKLLHRTLLFAMGALMLPIVATAASYKTKQVDSLLAKGMALSRHGRFEESNAVYQTLLSHHKMSKRGKADVYGRLATNADLMGDYKAYYEYLLLKEGKEHPSDEQSTARQMAALPTQKLDRPDKDVSIGYIVDSLYYGDRFVGCEIRVPATIGGETEHVILDNGCAKFCVASETFAKAHGIRPIDADGQAVGVTGTMSMWFGIADSLSIGELVFRNLIFVVLPDKHIDNSILQVNAMLGASFFRLAGEMVFDNHSHTITFPFVQEERASNLTIDSNGSHFVDAEVNGDSLTLQLDLGATRTSLSANYYLKFEEKVRATWTVTSSKVGGVGNLKDETVYAVAELPFSCCGGLFVKNNVSVSTEKKPNEGDEDGSIGNDFILSFAKATMNFKSMFLYVE